MQHVAPHCKWLLVMMVRQAGEDYNMSLYYRVGFSDYNQG